MITLVVRGEDGAETVLVGLTDVNLRRLPNDRPIRIDGSTLPPGADLVVFHATRDAILAIAARFGLDERILLDSLGEG